MPKHSVFPRFSVVFIVLVLLLTACSKPTPPPVSLEVKAAFPTITLEQGRSFEMTLSVANTGQYNARLTELRLPGSFLSKVAYEGSQPALTMTTGAGSEGLIQLDQTIAPGGVEVFVFRFNTVDPGDIQGNGTLSAGGSSFEFPMAVKVEGSNPAGYDPGVSPTSAPAPLVKIPFQSVVQIKALVEVDGQQMIGWSGSGTIISTDGLILTNAHVVLSDRFYQVKDLIVALTVAQDSPPVDTYLASIIQADANLDIALIKPRADINGNPIDVTSLNLPVVPFGDSDQLQLGDPITILGYPTIGGETITLTRGEVSGFTSEEAYGNRAFIKTSATIAGGNSGGLAVNDAGELIGVPTQLGSGDETSGYVDCRSLADTNRDGYVDENDTCIPTGGFINALRPINLTSGLVTAARNGEVAIMADKTEGEDYETTGEIIFSDDFSDPNSGWQTFDSADGSALYENGEFVFTVNQTGYLVWSVLDYAYDQVILSTAARLINPVGDSDFGFVCGYMDASHFTAIEISEDGYYSFWKQDGENYTTLIDWTYADQIAAGGPYFLSAACGTSHALAVNGVLMAEYQDPDFVPGSVGLMAGTFNNTGFKVGFDSFEVMLP